MMTAQALVVLVLLAGLSIAVLTLLIVVVLGKSPGHLFDAEQIRRVQTGQREFTTRH